MRKLTFLMMLTLVVTGLCAQQSLLVFMEASEKKPFYVKIGAKTSASTSTGQVYITELPDSNYEIQVGFPETDIPEHRFQVTLRKNDNNFQLKQGGSQGWTLIDLESNQTLQPLVQPAPASYAIGGVRKTDAFAIMMAGVVNDTSVLYTSVVPPAPPREQVVKKAPAVPAVGSLAGTGQAGTTPPAVASTNAQTGSNAVNRDETPGTEVPAKKPAVIDTTSEKRAEAVAVASGTDTKPVGDSGATKSVVLTGVDIAKEQAAKEQVVKDSLAKDQAARDLSAKDQAAKDQVAKDQAAKDLALKDQAAKEQATKDQTAKDELARTEAARELVAKEQAAKEQAAKEQAANCKRASCKRPGCQRPDCKTRDRKRSCCRCFNRSQTFRK